MTTEQIEQRPLEERLHTVEDALKKVTQRDDADDQPAWHHSLGMFADDPGFDEMIRLGREYRDRENAQTD